MPSDTPRTTPICHRTIGPSFDHDKGQLIAMSGDSCVGSRCALWYPKVRRFDHDGSGSITYVEGFGVCADNPDAEQWADVAAPKPVPS